MTLKNNAKSGNRLKNKAANPCFDFSNENQDSKTNKNELHMNSERKLIRYLSVRG